MRYNVAVAAMFVCTFASAEDRLDRLNVVALDPEGQPVLGLQSTDFRLLKDGKPQKIAFSRFTGYKPLAAARPASNEYANRPAAGLPATVILIDLLSDRTMSAAIIDQDITRALKNLESSEGLYLYMLTSSGELYPVHPLPKPDSEVTPSVEPWTRNIAPMLQAALKEVFSLKPIDDRDTKVRFDLTAKAMRELGAQMSLISGRKNLVWVTHGLPMTGPSISEQGLVDFTGPVRLLCEQLERAQIVVYPVEQSMKGAAATLGTESDLTLDEFAGLTGGREYRSGGFGEAIQHAMTDSRANYQLAYYAAAQNPDGKHRKLRVTCARKDVRLQTEAGSYAVLPPVRPGDLERLAFETAAHCPFDATEIGLRASVSPDPTSKQNVRFDVRIDPSDLLLTQTQDHRTGKVSLLFAAYGAKGLEQSSPPIPVNVSLTAQQYETATHEGVEVRQPIAVGATIRRVRVIVVDPELGTAGSVTIPVQH
jgi:VWFA-related protein